MPMPTACGLPLRRGAATLKEGRKEVLMTDVSVPVPSGPARLAEPGELFSLDELRLASRNHAMPLEALVHDVTPVGLHYVLVHYDIPFLDSRSWTVAFGGQVERPLTLTVDDLRSMASRTVRVTLECAGNGRVAMEPRTESQPWINGAVGTADWTGVPVRDLLDDVGVTAGAVDVVFTGADHGFERGVEQDYARALPIAEARGDDVLLAFEMNGAPIPPQHGAPVRLVVPGWYGMAHVKWVREVTVVAAPFEGFQHAAYRLRTEADEAGAPVTRILPRAVLVPPGVPDFMSRSRVLRPGPLVLTGRAWSGWGPVDRVEVSTDDARVWRDANLGAQVGRWAWRSFALPWDATPGRHVLRVRAHDATGRVQPRKAEWNRGSFANNGDQPLAVTVLQA